MADPPTNHERDATPRDPAAAFEDTNHEEPRDEDGSDKEYLEKHGELSTSSDGEKEFMSISGEPSSGPLSEGDINEEKRPEMKQVQSYATTNSAITRTESNLDHQAIKKPWYKKPNPLRWGKTPPVPDSRGANAEHTASFFSLLYFQWMAPIMSVGYRRPLEKNDIWTVNPSRGVDHLSNILQTSFKRRVANGDKYPLLWAMHETFKWEFWIGGGCQFISNILQVVSPFTLRYLITFASEAYVAAQTGQPAPNIGRGLGLVFGITIMQMIQSLGTNHFIYRGMIVGGQTRAVMISSIFEKAMTISARAKAGGRSIQDQEDEKDAQNAQNLVDQAKGKKKGKKSKDSKAPDAGRGISGDGTGWANGRVVNLMSVDTYRIDQASGMFHLIWTAPISCIITLILLLVNLTYSALAGFGLLIIGLPLLTKAVKSLFVRRKAVNKITDQRVSLTQEILSAVRFVKYFGWETAFLDRLDAIRNKEIHAIQILLAIRNAINAVSMSMPIFASMLAFICYSLTSHGLNPAEVFSSLALFNSLRLPLNLLPMVIGQVTDAWSSVIRIQEYLLSEEQEDDSKVDRDLNGSVVLQSADFTWERIATQDPEKLMMPGKKQTKADIKVEKQVKKQTAKDEKAAAKARPTSAQMSDSPKDDASTLNEDKEPFKLHNMNFTIGRNELVAVIGGVGSGKSSLLAALAGDMRKTRGEMMMGADRAFCPQYAWIQNATVRDNILFGKDMNRSWYNKVIDACALRPDLDMLPSGDATEIGERGITVSGGQKQRMNIARAIYFDADLILMDDPLSAVDSHVGRHIFDNAIMGLLKNKSRILATHQLWVLHRCDRIIWLEDGKIQAIDTFPNLMRDHVGFQTLMETTAVEEEHEEEDKANEDEVEDEKKTQKKKRKAPGLMQAEEKSVSSVSWTVYADYIRASGSILNAPLVFLLLILSQGANIATSLWLSWWTSDKFGYSTGKYIGVYAALGAGQALLLFFFALALTMLGTIASKKMLNQAITKALRAPMSFFDTTPLGRITNRFSRDVDVMDNNLTDAIRMYFLTMGMIISVFALIIAYFHYFAIALGPLLVLFLFAAGYYRASAREMKRFESVFRSNVFAKFSEGLSGTATIRAYGLKDRFIMDLRKAIDEMDSAYFLTFANQRWLSTRLDMIGNLLVFTTGILVVTSRFNVGPSTAGLVLSYILSIVQMIQFTVRQLAEVENGMNATERLHYYATSLEEEAPLHTVEVRPSWPEKGEIIFNDVQMRYRADLPLVLSNLSMHVKGGERIGVVGRTGAGKSSIMSTLFRLVELSGGSITIDGLDISTLGLHDLRSHLAIIPQDPTLFKGTIRSNLDPFSEHTDLELYSALRQSDLVASDSKLEDETTGRIHLDSVVEDEGMNFSLGQRQLMALARALVRGSQIIVCDEATSSVDMETDEKIQRTIQQGFKGKTLLCIAHRLKTIIGYDRICVMDKGSIAELDEPIALWERGGIFRSMCDRSGIRREDFNRAAIPSAKEKDEH